jgi:hypothetical protein
MDVLSMYKEAIGDQEAAPELDKAGATIQKMRDTRENLLQQIADNIRKSAILRVEITKGVQNGLSDRELLVKAIECISLMTGDKAFMQNIDRLR